MDLVCYAAADSAAPPPEAEARDVLTYAAWGSPLSLPQYLERERRLWRHPFSRGLQRFVLQGGGEPVASCESYAVPVRTPSGKGGVGHGIASVYVEERLRGRGYARALLTAVHEHLRRQGALLTYLMSEIDPGLYERLGYVARPLRRRRFSAPLPGEPEPGLDQLTYLTMADVPALLARRYQRPERGLSLRLTPEQLDWHEERARFYGEVLGGPQPSRVGARCGDAFILWTPDVRAGLLRVLCLYPGPGLWEAGTIVDPRDPEAAALRNVLHGARAEAAHAGLSAVELWESARSGWLRGGQSLEPTDLPMLRPLEKGVRAEDWLDWERGHWL